MQKYYRLGQYEGMLNYLIQKKFSFIVELTSYTRTIKIGEDRLMFNNTGKFDKSLTLINRVRKDAADFMNLHPRAISSDSISFYSLVNEIPNTLVSKVDVRAAYWNMALKRGIITNKTNNYFLEHWGYVKSENAKIVRLKALGSLATRKRILEYIEGIPDIKNQEDYVQDTKPLYMSICRDVDYLMKDASKIEGVFYYYWDCVFAKSENSGDVIQCIKNQQFDVTVDETLVKHKRIGDSDFLITVNDGKAYIIRDTEKHFLTNGINEYAYG